MNTENILKSELMRFMNGDRPTAWKLEDALRADSDLWKDYFFRQFFQGEQRKQYEEREDLRTLCDELFRQAFMFGGCHFQQVLTQRLKAQISAIDNKLKS